MSQDKRQALRGAVEGILQRIQELLEQDWWESHPDHMLVAMAVLDFLVTIGHPRSYIAEQWVDAEYRWEPPQEPTECDWGADADTAMRDEVREELEDAYRHQIEDLEHKVRYWQERAEAAEKALPHETRRRLAQDGS